MECLARLKFHLNDILLCLRKNIKILVEKPCVINMKEAKKLFKQEKVILLLFKTGGIKIIL